LRWSAERDCGDAAAGEDLQLEEPRVCGQREREGGDGEHEPPHPERAAADEHGDECGDGGADHHGEHERDAVELEEHDLAVGHDPVHDEAAGERGAGERADAGKGHLSQGELSRPPGEHREGERAHGEGCDGRVEQLLGGLGHQERHGHRSGEEREQHDPVEVANPPDAPQPRG